MYLNVDCVLGFLSILIDVLKIKSNKDSDYCTSGDI